AMSLLQASLKIWRYGHVEGGSMCSSTSCRSRLHQPRACLQLVKFGQSPHVRGVSPWPAEAPSCFSGWHPQMGQVPMNTMQHIRMPNRPADYGLELDGRTNNDPGVL